MNVALQSEDPGTVLLVKDGEREAAGQTRRVFFCKHFWGANMFLHWPIFVVGPRRFGR